MIDAMGGTININYFNEDVKCPENNNKIRSLGIMPTCEDKNFASKTCTDTYGMENCGPLYCAESS